MYRSKGASKLASVTNVFFDTVEKEPSEAAYSMICNDFDELVTCKVGNSILYHFVRHYPKLDSRRVQVPLCFFPCDCQSHPGSPGELARNSVLMSGFSENEKKLWTGARDVLAHHAALLALHIAQR